MFQLRDEHIQAFEAASMDAFERRAVAHLRQNFPRETAPLSDDQLRERVRRDADRAKQYGFVTEHQIMCFVDTGFLLSEDFDSRPETGWTQIILQHPDFTADKRARVLLAGAEKAVSEEARRGGE